MRPIGPLAIGLTPMETRREVVVALAQEAERAGYAGFFVAEGWGHDAGVLLAEVALRTRRIALATGVLNVWGRSAGGIAMLAAGLAELSQGRFTLGLGAGSPQLAQGLHDVPFHEPVRRLAHTTRQVRRLLDGEGIVPSDGAVRPLRLAIRPEVRVPIHLAALGPAAVRVTGELADGWSPFLLPLSQLARRRRHLAEAASAAGRDAVVAVNPAIPVAIEVDGDAGPVPGAETSSALADWWLRFYLTRMGPLYPHMLREAGFGDAVEHVIATSRDGAGDRRPASALDGHRAALAEELLLTGRPGAAAARLRSWREAGADLPVLVLPPGRPLDSLVAMVHALAPGSAADTAPEITSEITPGSPISEVPITGAGRSVELRQ